MVSTMQRTARQSWQEYLKTSTRITKYKAEAMVVHIDDDIIALNKPPGVAVHEGPGLKDGYSLASNMTWWQYQNEVPPSLAHRIDKNTTGIVLLSRNKSAAQEMAELFKRRKIIKKYCAVCVGIPDTAKGSIQIPLGIRNVSTLHKKTAMHRVTLRQDRQSDYRKSNIGSTVPGNIQLALTNYQVLSSTSVNHHGDTGIASLIEVTPVTGFRHQIRVHLADGLLCPIVGDYRFAGPLFRQHSHLASKMSAIGRTKGFIRGPMYLHAWQVQIPKGKGKMLTIKAPIPDYFIKTCEALELNTSKYYQRLV